MAPREVEQRLADPPVEHRDGLAAVEVEGEVARQHAPVDVGHGVLQLVVDSCPGSRRSGARAGAGPAARPGRRPRRSARRSRSPAAGRWCRPLRSGSRARRRATACAWRRPTALSGMSSCPWMRRRWFHSVSPWRTRMIVGRHRGQRSVTRANLRLPTCATKVPAGSFRLPVGDGGAVDAHAVLLQHPHRLRRPMRPGWRPSAPR